MRVLNTNELGAVAGGDFMDLSYQTNDIESGGYSSSYGGLTLNPVLVAAIAAVAAVTVAVIQSCTGEKTTTIKTEKSCDDTGCTTTTTKETITKEKG